MMEKETIENLKILFTGLSFLIGFGTFIFSCVNSYKNKEITKEQQRISKEQEKISKGQMEIQINRLISDSKLNLLKFSKEILSQEQFDKQKAQMYESYRELYFNAYEEACTKYLDEKVDKIRFKKSYEQNIIDLVKNEENQEKFSKIDCPYTAILKVFHEWNNKEND